MSVLKNRRWLIEFGVVCLVPIVLLGVFLMQTLKSNVEGRAISNAQEQARLVTDIGIATTLSGVDDLSGGLSAPQGQALDRQLATIRKGNNIDQAILRSRDGKVVYADDHTLLGQVHAPAGARDAQSTGHIASGVTSNAAGQQVLEVVVPLTLQAGAAAGSAQLTLPYAPILASIDRQNRKIELMLVAGLLLLW